MSRTLVRSGAIGIAALGLVASGLPAAAVAPQEWVEQGTHIECGSGTDGTEVFAGGFFAPDGTFADGGGGIVIGDEGYWASDATGSFINGSWVLDLSLVSGADGTPAGTMRAAGDAMPLGDPAVIDERLREGNAWTTLEGTVQPLLVSGAIVDGSGVAADLIGTDLDCTGDTVDLTYGGTNPATRVFRWSGASAFCPFGEDGVFALEAQGDEAFGAVALGIDWSAETAAFFAEGALAVGQDSVTGTLDVVEPPDTGGQVIVDLSIGDQVDKGHIRETWRQGAYFERYTRYALTGTIILPDSSVVELDGCTLTRSSSKSRDSMRAGQKPGGKAPANDLPDAAVALGMPASATVSTRGAAELAEAPCSAEWGELPFGRTVWYSIQGTGGVIRLSTEGSDFDTVMGVYDTALGQVACVDDTEETGLQAALDLPTEAGVGYLVQVGGFAGDWGTAVISAG